MQQLKTAVKINIEFKTKFNKPASKNENKTVWCKTVDQNVNKKPSWCWDSQPSVGIFGIFLIFGSNTPTWSVENQLNLWATNCVVNQTGYFGPLYASRHQTSLWRHQHIYSVQLPQTG